MTVLKFSKMHGLGNDFMVIDAILQNFTPKESLIKQWSDRHFGIGFDQLLLVECADSPNVDFRYRIFNADGGEVQQCGNGARCFARFVHEHGLSDKREIVVQTASGIIKPCLTDNGWVTVNMGKPRFTPAQIPFVPPENLAEEKLTYTIKNKDFFSEFSVLSMGNPHAVMCVNNVKTAPVSQWGEALQQHVAFPERVNVGFMQVIDKNHILLRVYERGTGETLACGTGACAAVVSGIRLGILASDEDVRVSLPGGNLLIRWQENTDVLMTGAAVTVFHGEVDVDNGV